MKKSDDGRIEFLFGADAWSHKTYTKLPHHVLNALDGAGVTMTELCTLLELLSFHWPDRECRVTVATLAEKIATYRGKPVDESQLRRQLKSLVKKGIVSSAKAAKRGPGGVTAYSFELLRALVSSRTPTGAAPQEADEEPAEEEQSDDVYVPSTSKLGKASFVPVESDHEEPTGVSVTPMVADAPTSDAVSRIECLHDDEVKKLQGLPGYTTASPANRKAATALAVRYAQAALNGVRDPDATWENIALALRGQRAPSYFETVATEQDQLHAFLKEKNAAATKRAADERLDETPLFDVAPVAFGGFSFAQADCND